MSPAEQWTLFPQSVDLFSVHWRFCVCPIVFHCSVMNTPVCLYFAFHAWCAYMHAFPKGCRMKFKFYICVFFLSRCSLHTWAEQICTRLEILIADTICYDKSLQNCPFIWSNNQTRFCRCADVDGILNIHSLATEIDFHASCTQTILRDDPVHVSTEWCIQPEHQASHVDSFSFTQLKIS